MSRNPKFGPKFNLAPDPERVAELTKLLPERAQGLGRPISDRAAWEAVGAHPVAIEARRRATGILDDAPPELTAELYLIFSKTGSRVEYQEAFFHRQGRLRLFALAECLEDTGRFLPALEKELAYFLDLPSWNLPAHDGHLKNFRGEIVTADLTVNMAAWTLGTMHYWLGDRLAKPLQQRLLAEIRRRVLDPYHKTITTGDVNDGMWWVDTDSNWNSVCTSGTLGAALATVEDPAERAWYLACAEKLLPHFLDGFGPDGYCSEGLGYWNYGFGYYACAAEAVFEVTGGRLNWFADPRVIQVSRYPQRLQISPGRYPSFSDCGLNMQPTRFLVKLLNRRIEGGTGLDSELTAAQSPKAAANGLEQLNAVAITLFGELGAVEPAPVPLSLRDEFPQAGVLLLRLREAGPRTLALALKGGHNAEMHNHNDVGTFVLQVGDEPIILDSGNEVYTARTFGQHRYESTANNSYGHSVPVVGGQLQHTSAEAKALVLERGFTDAEDVYRLDLRSCYLVDSLQELTREFRYSREGLGRLVVTDHVRFSAPTDFGVGLITFAAAQAEGDDVLILTQNGNSLRIKISVEGGKLAPLQIEPLPDGSQPKRLGLNFASPVTQATIRLEFTPLTL